MPSCALNRSLLPGEGDGSSVIGAALLMNLDLRCGVDEGFRLSLAF
jgi:hypothetical protein